MQYGLELIRQVVDLAFEVATCCIVELYKVAKYMSLNSHPFAGEEKVAECIWQLAWTAQATAELPLI